MRYESRMRRVVEHVYEHLDEPLDLASLADVACMSPYHWHRVYHALYGETMAATVKRLRLHRAAGYLAHSTLPIEQIARQAGYPNPQSFTRIFKAAYRMPPARYRAAGNHAEFTRPATAAPDTGHSVAIRELPSIDVVAVDHRGSYMGVGQAFDLLFGRLAAQRMARPGMRSLAMFLDDPSSVPEGALRAQACVAGCAPGPLEAPLYRTRIAPGPYAVLAHKGPYASMKAAYQWLFGVWLGRCGREPADAPMVEEYLNSPRETAPADLLTNICLPLRALVAQERDL